MTTGGGEYDDVVAEARELGYLEADPSADVEGRDAADKVVLLARLAYGGWVDVSAVRPCAGCHLGRRAPGYHRGDRFGDRRRRPPRSGHEAGGLRGARDGRSAGACPAGARPGRRRRTSGILAGVVPAAVGLDLDPRHHERRHEHRGDRRQNRSGESPSWARAPAAPPRAAPSSAISWRSRGAGAPPGAASRRRAGRPSRATSSTASGAGSSACRGAWGGRSASGSWRRRSPRPPWPACVRHWPSSPR